ncbi:MAG: hypothetical protein DLM72_00405 [Candidatus Nitrosopolaris wilkensis]|nr:MAG: hypothetical protein DLM72_00405 [Candidatus Nitrosopolaris wilkensis]
MYVCTSCSQHFTRKYSANRHNNSIHVGRAEIVPYIDYMAGRNSGQYAASDPLWYRSNQRHTPSNRNYNNIGSGTVADTRASSQTDNLFQKPPLPSRLQENNPKIEELMALLDRYTPPEEAPKILEWAKIGLRQGDEKFLNLELQQLRTLARAEGWRPF